MTALEMIREGFDVWIEGFTGGFEFAPVFFMLLFLLGFLATCLLRAINIQQSVIDSAQISLSAKGREIIDDANTARLFELESELAASKGKQERFTETLSSTFAHLSGGLAVFDADKSLHLFNPALSELLDLDPVWLAGRPSIADFISKLREKRHLPEKKNFLEWRRLLTNLGDSGSKTNYEDEWVLPDGRIFRVIAQPQPKGAVAFQFEDFSAKIAIDRRYHLDKITHDAILNNISSAIIVVHPSGLVKFTNPALSDLFDAEVIEILVNTGIPIAASDGFSNNDTAKFWSKLKTYASTSGHRTSWEQQLDLSESNKLKAIVSALPDGTTLVVFNAEAKNSIETVSDYSGESGDFPDPIGFCTLKNLLRQRNISFDIDGFDIAKFDQFNAVKLRRVFWYLTVSASDHCRTGGEIFLSSTVTGEITRLSCYVAKQDWLDGANENLASKLLKQLVEQPDIKDKWYYDFEIGRFTVSIKAQQRLKHSGPRSV